MSVSTTICTLAENVLNNFFVLWRDETRKIIDHFAYETEEDDVTLIVESALGNAHQAKNAKSAQNNAGHANTSNPASSSSSTTSSSSASSTSGSSSTSTTISTSASAANVLTASSSSLTNNNPAGVESQQSTMAQQSQQPASMESPLSGDSANAAAAAAINSSQAPNPSSAISSDVGDPNFLISGGSVGNPALSSSQDTLTPAANTAASISSTSLIKTPKAFEQFQYSFATVSKHCSDAVLEALCEWLANLDCYPPHHIKAKIEESLRTSNRRSSHKQELLLQLYAERKQVAADYMFCRIVLLMMGRHSEPLSQSVASQLEEIAITHFVNSEKQLQTGIPSLLESKKKVLDMLAEVVGFLSIHRFQTLADKFLRNIESRLHSNTSKTEACHFVRGMRFMRLQISKAESLSETTQFLRRVLELFKRSKKKTELKVSFCESLSSMLSPLVAFEYKDSTEYRDWFSLLRDCHIYALKQQKKSKYVNCSHQLISTILCASSKQYFLDNFWPHIESLLRLFKVASSRLVATDCIVHVIGFYLTIVAEMENPEDHGTSTSSSSSVPSPLSTSANTQSFSLLPVKSQSPASAVSTSTSSASPMVTTVNRKEVIERLQKIASALCGVGRKSPPNPENELLYDALVDVIVVISNRKLDFAMNGIIMELLCGDSPLTENTFVGMKAFMSIADRADVHKLSPLLDDPSKSTAIQLWPEWALNILDKHAVRTQRSAASASDEEDWASKSAWNAVRIKSPFSSFGRTDSHHLFQRSSSAFGPVIRHSPADLFSDSLGITPYEIGLSRLFSNILTHCDSKYGQLLLPSQFVLLSELQPKDKILGLHVFEMAIRCITRLLPCELSAQFFAELLCRCSIHQHEGIRQVSWDSIVHLMKFRPELRAEIIHAFVDLVSMLSDFRMDIRESVVRMLVRLLRQWEQLVSAKDRVSQLMSDELTGPTIYGNLKAGEQSVFEPARVEGCALMLLCSIKGSNRKLALDMIHAVRGIVTALRAQTEEEVAPPLHLAPPEQDTIHDRIPSDLDLPNTALITNAASPAFSGTLMTSTLLDEVLQQSSVDVIQKAWKHFPSSLLKPPQVAMSSATLSSLAGQEDAVWQTLWSECLREIGRLSSEMCPMSAHYCIGMLAARLIQLRDILTKTPTTPNVIEMWRNYVSFFCSVSVLDEGLFGDSFTTDERSRRRTPRDTPRRSITPENSLGGTGFYTSHSTASLKSLLDGIVPFIQHSMEAISTIAVRAIGCAHTELIDSIIVHLQSIEDEAGLSTEKDKPKGKKRRDFIRSQIARVFALITEAIHPTVLVDRVRIRSRLTEFVRQQLAYLSMPVNLLDVSLQQLRLDLFAIVEHLAQKLHTAFPPSVIPSATTAMTIPVNPTLSTSPSSPPTNLSGTTDLAIIPAGNVTLSAPLAPASSSATAGGVTAPSVAFLTVEDRIKHKVKKK